MPSLVREGGPLAVDESSAERQRLISVRYADTVRTHPTKAGGDSGFCHLPTHHIQVSKIQVILWCASKGRAFA